MNSRLQIWLFGLLNALRSALCAHDAYAILSTYAYGQYYYRPQMLYYQYQQYNVASCFTATQYVTVQCATVYQA